MTQVRCQTLAQMKPVNYRPLDFVVVQIDTDPGEEGLDKTLPIGSAIFHVLGVFVTSCTCIVKSRKSGCFQKSTTESGCGQVI